MSASNLRVAQPHQGAIWTNKIVLVYDPDGNADGQRFPIGTPVTTELTIDADGNLQLPDGFEITGNLVMTGTLDMNGNVLYLDADADTYLDPSVDDVVDIYLNGAKDFVLSANTFTAQSGSTVATNTIAETTAASGVTIDGLRVKDAAITPAVGGAAWADLSNCATGEGDIVLAPNLASAYERRDSVGSTVRDCTTTGARRHEVIIPLELQGGYRLATYAIPRVEEFYGDVGATLPADYAKDVHGDATGDYITAQGAGVYRLATAVTSEAEGAQITGGDALHVLLSKEPIVEFRVRISPAGAAFTADERLVIGLVSAHANAEDSLDATTYNLWFRVEGASLAVVVEKDDNAANVDDQASGLTVVKDTWHTFRIDCSTISAPVLSMDGTAQSGAALSMSAASAQFLQPIVCMQRDAGTEINTLDVDYIAVYQKR